MSHSLSNSLRESSSNLIGNESYSETIYLDDSFDDDNVSTVINIETQALAPSIPPPPLPHEIIPPPPRETTINFNSTFNKLNRLYAINREIDLDIINLENIIRKKIDKVQELQDELKKYSELIERLEKMDFEVSNYLELAEEMVAQHSSRIRSRQRQLLLDLQSDTMKTFQEMNQLHII